MTERSKRLAQYLENTHGWEVYVDYMFCPKCDCNRYGSDIKYCSTCGDKLTEDFDRHAQVEQELEDAIKYALEE